MDILSMSRPSHPDAPRGQQQSGPIEAYDVEDAAIVAGSRRAIQRSKGLLLSTPVDLQGQMESGLMVDRPAFENAGAVASFDVETSQHIKVLFADLYELERAIAVLQLVL